MIPLLALGGGITHWKLKRIKYFTDEFLKELFGASEHSQLEERFVNWIMKFNLKRQKFTNSSQESYLINKIFCKLKKQNK